MTRRPTRLVHVGQVPVGGNSPISVQTMLDDDPCDIEGIVSHIGRCAAAGASIVRLAVPDAAAAAALHKIRPRSALPIVADIHFDYRLALSSIDAGVDALRINPGNIGAKENIRLVAQAAAAKGIPIRVGVNGGSLEKGESLVSSALSNLALLENEGFRDVVLSVKASTVKETLDAYGELSTLTDCPLHVGLTEAGTLLRGTVHSSVAMGILLSEGIGDTIRVSLTDTPEKEVQVALEILNALGLAPPGISVTSCPTCGRTKVDLKSVAAEVENALRLAFPPGRRLAKPLRVAVMGCVVNGPGEAKGCDVALCGAAGDFIIYKHGVQTGRVSQSEAAAAVVDTVAAIVG